ncbi:MAG: large conductance mechanosensitive channel protein MscL [Elainella sp. Prado103]|jgi:large conductance mechanosensitive channel|nr:large conductance mechanosensitive channel protein MscL [Elainella sp. Prado103]
MARRRATGFLRDFQDFIKRGNVVDLAVAVILGGAFGSVVDEVVKLITGALLNPAMQAAGVERLADWPAGSVIVALINFIVIAFVVFLIVRALEQFKRKEEAAEAAPDPAVVVQQQLADATNRLASALESRQL